MKVFGVFMPYHKDEILDSCYEGYDELPSYPIWLYLTVFFLFNTAFDKVKPLFL